MPQTYTPEFKKKIVRLHLEEGRTYKSITAEYSRVLSEFRGLFRSILTDLAGIPARG